MLIPHGVGGLSRVYLWELAGIAALAPPLPVGISPASGEIDNRRILQNTKD